MNAHHFIVQVEKGFDHYVDDDLPDRIFEVGQRLDRKLATPSVGTVLVRRTYQTRRPQRAVAAVRIAKFDRTVGRIDCRDHHLCGRSATVSTAAVPPVPFISTLSHISSSVTSAPASRPTFTSTRVKNRWKRRSKVLAIELAHRWWNDCVRPWIDRFVKNDRVTA